MFFKKHVRLIVFLFPLSIFTNYAGIHQISLFENTKNKTLIVLLFDNHYLGTPKTINDETGIWNTFFNNQNPSTTISCLFEMPFLYIENPPITDKIPSLLFEILPRMVSLSTSITIKIENIDPRGVVALAIDHLKTKKELFPEPLVTELLNLKNNISSTTEEWNNLLANEPMISFSNGVYQKIINGELKTLSILVENFQCDPNNVEIRNSLLELLGDMSFLHSLVDLVILQKIFITKTKAMVIYAGGNHMEHITTILNRTNQVKHIKTFGISLSDSINENELNINKELHAILQKINNPKPTITDTTPLSSISPNLSKKVSNILFRPITPPIK